MEGRVRVNFKTDVEVTNIDLTPFPRIAQLSGCKGLKQSLTSQPKMNLSHKEIEFIIGIKEQICLSVLTWPFVSMS